MGDEDQSKTQCISQIKLPIQDNYEIAYNEAAEELAKSNIYEIVKKSGSRITERDGCASLLLPFLNDTIVISYPDITISYQQKNDNVPLWLKILALHYLIYAEGTSAIGDQITFKQLEGGLGYYPAFQKRTTIPLIDVFGDNLEDFIEFGSMTGGVKADYGDYALTFRAFPRVDIIIVFWKGDDEFPIEGTVIFDSSIRNYFTTEDVAVLCNMIAVMIIKKKFS